MLRKVIESLIVGFNGESFSDIANYLLTGAPVADPYMCMADYESYLQRPEENVRALSETDKRAWNQKSLQQHRRSRAISPPTGASKNTRRTSGTSNRCTECPGKRNARESCKESLQLFPCPHARFTASAPIFVTIEFLLWSIAWKFIMIPWTPPARR